MSKYSEKKERQLRERLAEDAAQSAAIRTAGEGKTLSEGAGEDKALSDGAGEGKTLSEGAAVKSEGLTVPMAESDEARERRRKELIAVRVKLWDAARMLEEARDELRMISKRCVDPFEKQFVQIASDKCGSAWGRAKWAMDYVHN